MQNRCALARPDRHNLSAIHGLMFRHCTSAAHLDALHAHSVAGASGPAVGAHALEGNGEGRVVLRGFLAGRRARGELREEMVFP